MIRRQPNTQRVSSLRWGVNFFLFPQSECSTTSRAAPLQENLPDDVVEEMCATLVLPMHPAQSMRFCRGL